MSGERAFLLFYNRLLTGVEGIAIPLIRENVKHVFHLYVIRGTNRDALRNHLAEKGISTGIHYPTPLPFLNAYKYLSHKPEDFPIANEYMDKLLSLPMYPELMDCQINYIVDSINEFYE